jgi:uncharacterized protein (TIGR01777 family)
MKVVVPGGSGFLGGALAHALRRDGHSVVVLTRRATDHATEVEWRPDGSVGPWAQTLDGADVVINLAGANLAGRRWTTARKKLLRDSRVLPSRSLANAIRQARRKPHVLVSASGVGYYGDRGNEIVTEDTSAGHDFLAQLCVEWEREVLNVADLTRVVLLRNGVVLHPSGGALAKMLLPFRMGIGGKLGSGQQYFPWIHLDDWLALVMHLIQTEAARGASNATAPTPATNEQFTRALGQTLGRPTIMAVPAVALRIALGELADTLLTGQRAIPARALQTGFVFRFREIGEALRDLLR